MTAENYHLKWDSHHSYLNSSVATLYKNEKFADVVLYSCNSTVSTNNLMPTAVGISAHKFILSSCSQFFSNIFETSPIANNGNFHIVLPPDLSHRAIQILVQYMYMGEATVSNDILSEVLKGGEILKIRGLCRTSSPATTNMAVNRSTEPLTQPTPTTNNGATYNLIRVPLTTGPTSVRYLVEQQATTVSRGLNVSALPKTSPVIVKSTKPLNTITVPTTVNVNIGKLATQTSNPISINKHVAIDPGEKCCYPPETSSALRDEPSSICNEIGCNDCTRMTENQAQQTGINECEEEMVYEQEVHLSGDHNADYNNGGGGMNENFKYSQQHLISTTSAIVATVAAPPLPTSTSTKVVVHEATTAAPPTYVSIKEEPSEWTASTTTSSSIHSIGNSSLHSSSSLLNKKTAAQSNDYKMQKIKTEPPPQPHQPPPTTFSSLKKDSDTCQLISTPSSSSNQLTSSNDFEPSYFNCDICKKVCEDKTSLLRHLETHAPATPGTSSSFNAPPPPPAICETATAAPSKSSYVPKKRRRISQQENASEHVCLQCDICNTRFETPQEWVRHMSTQHTEVELAIFNNKKEAEKNNQQPTTSNHNKKQSGNVQQQQQQQQHNNPQQRVQGLISSGSTNSNITNSTSVVCTSSLPTSSGGGSVGGGGINDPNATGYLRSTLSPA
ncbi:uncharacterized protein isoform X2 [Musca autumnalis]|uniref:uncharacterized protein isoform X2 n=1 Tax=Musca autumnalis TaxID=221902 RepID=UPI003CE83385